MKSYKAIIFDLDGTAIPNAPNAEPSQLLIDTIRSAQSRLKLCAATGRPITNASYILEALNLTDPCIVSGGTQIIDPKSKKILWETSMDMDSAKKVVEICKPYSYKLLLREELLDEGSVASEVKIDAPLNIMYLMQVSSSDANVILPKLAEVEKITASPVPSWKQDRIDIHITGKDATKEHAMEELLKMLGVMKEETIGVGDGDNDKHLFASVGFKVAMGNATKTLKDAADIITDNAEEDGLAKIIAEYS